MKKEDMKVVILCGGQGARLKEETEFRPKPMVQIGKQPILQHIMKIYAHQGYKNFVLCLGYKGEMIKEYFLNYEIMNNDFTIELGAQKHVSIHSRHQEAGWKVTLADTGVETLKGSRLKRIERYIDTENFFMTYGDGVADIDLSKLYEFHLKHGRIITVTGVNPTARFGELKVEENKVTNFWEKQDNNQNWINGGFFVCNRLLFDYLKPDGSDLEYGPFEEIAAAGEMMVYKHKGFWACMDTLRDREHLNSLWRQSKASWKIWEDENGHCGT